MAMASGLRSRSIELIWKTGGEKIAKADGLRQVVWNQAA